MAIESKCLTPEAVYKTHLNPERLLIQVDFGQTLELSEEEASLLEILIHNQLELALSKFWPGEKQNEERRHQSNYQGSRKRAPRVFAPRRRIE